MPVELQGADGIQTLRQDGVGEVDDAVSVLHVGGVVGVDDLNRFRVPMLGVSFDISCLHL